ncbi:MAG: antitoxin [Gammaproteobacteria bacterium]|nr:MAG: antitoxin [Gammaproteobacteria bacterium]
MKHVFATCSASISELKKNPTALLKEAEGEPIAILNHNVPTAYLVPAATYERMLERLEDVDLGKIVRGRAVEKNDAIEVGLDDL